MNTSRPRRRPTNICQPCDLFSMIRRNLLYLRHLWAGGDAVNRQKPAWRLRGVDAPRLLFTLLRWKIRTACVGDLPEAAAFGLRATKEPSALKCCGLKSGGIVADRPHE